VAATELAHVGYLARDLDEAVERARATFALPVARTLELPQFDLSAVFLGPGTGTVELFTFNDPELLERRLGERDLMLDHTALLVDDIASTMSSMAAIGASFSGPDGRLTVSEPFELGGALHAWSGANSGGWSLQLIQPLG